jgi:hypothetical protein
MADRDYPNSAIAFVNDRDRKSDRDPHLKGNGSIECPFCNERVEFWLSVWRKTGARAGEFLSLSLRAKTGGAVNTAPLRDLDETFPPQGGRHR